MLTSNYEKIQDPLSRPSPIARIEVSSPYDSTNRSKDIKAILDTGAGITVIPESIIEKLEKLKELPHRPVRVRSHLDKNNTSYRILYTVIIKFYGQENEIEVLAIPRDYAIIGRDILNQYKITLNGPEGTWSIE